MSNDIFYDKSRLSILAVLIAEKSEITFNDLIEKTQLTKGNLSSHLKKLEDEKIIKIDKFFKVKKPVTTIQLTTIGRKQFLEYLSQMENLIKNSLKRTT